MAPQTNNLARSNIGRHRKTTARLLAERYIEQYWNKEGIQNKSALARLLCNEHPLVYTSVEHARLIIRDILGSHGEKRAKGNERPELLDMEWRANIPIPDGDNYNQSKIWECPPENDKILIIGDTHINFHSKAALDIAIERGHKEGCNTLLINGDAVDHFDYSPFPTDPKLIDPNYTFYKAQEILQAIASWCDGWRIIYNEGNHERWWQKYLWSHSWKISKLRSAHYPEFFQLAELGIHEYLEGIGEMRFGKITGVHGHEINARSAVNPARGLFLRYLDNIFCNHWHRSTHHSEPTGRGKPIVTWSVGCLCKLEPAPEYAGVGSKMEQGFATLKWDKHEFEFRNYKIYGNRIYGE